ncbi:MAG: DUF4157 domain-containing protein [Sinomicrobium sp.]|nr:DUF4157 domain-containing protein [Sinomicrobium sp.]
MRSRADKKQENKRKIGNDTVQTQSNGETAYQSVDNRPEIIAQRKLQETINNNSRVQQLMTIQQSANNSPRTKQLSSIQETVNNGHWGQKAARLQAMTTQHILQKTAQFMKAEEEEEKQESLQGRFETIQQAASGEEEEKPLQKKTNNTGLPDTLKTGIENLSGHSMDDVNVHYNSDKPKQLQAHAYAQGTDIHLSPGQEKHLPHEAWHVVQQKQDRVKPTKQLKSKVNINDDPGLEQEATAMGARANRSGDSGVSQYRRLTNKPVLQAKLQSNVIQRVSEEETGAYLGYTFGGDKPSFYFEQGHYTWQHKKKKNEGWHPNKGTRHFVKNIDEEVHKKYSDDYRGKWDRKQKTAFGKKIEEGKYDAKEGEGKMIEGSVYVRKDKSEKIILHPSRGRLIKVGDKDFDEKYNEEFVRSIVSKGKLAENETKL